MLRCLITGKTNLQSALALCNTSSAPRPASAVRAFSSSQSLRTALNQHLSLNSASDIDNTIHTYELSSLLRLAYPPDESCSLSPDNIKEAYSAIKAKGLAHQLSSDELTSLIRLFGSLSIRYASPFEAVSNSGDFSSHPLTTTLSAQQKEHRSHWPFVLSCAKDKAAKGHELNNSDNFWLMRAAFADAARFASAEAVGNVEQCLDRAYTYYLNIRFLPDDWELHHFYLSTLRQFGPERSANLILRALCRLLERTGHIHVKLRMFLWTVITSEDENGNAIAEKTKRRFLEVVRKRVGRMRDVLPLQTPASGQSSNRPPLPPSIAALSSFSPSTPVKSSSQDRQCFDLNYDASMIRDYLAHILFARSPDPSPSQNYVTRYASVKHLRPIYPWALFEARAALCAFNDGSFLTSEDEDRAAWNSLKLLAISYLPDGAGSTRGNATKAKPNTGLDGGIEHPSQVLGWTIICMLSAITSEVQAIQRSHLPAPSPSRSYSAYFPVPSLREREIPSAEDIREIARTLWILWRKEEAWRAGAVVRHSSLICSAAASFMSLAATSHDTRLASSLIRYIADAVIYPAQFGAGDGVTEKERDMLVGIAVQYGILHLQGRKKDRAECAWEELWEALQYAQLIPDGKGPSEWKGVVASKLLAEYATSEPLHAFRLAHPKTLGATAVNAKSIVTVGKALAASGYAREAALCVQDGRLDFETASGLLDAMLKILGSPGRRTLDNFEIRALRDAIIETKSIQVSAGKALEVVLERAMRAGLNADCFDIVRVLWDAKVPPAPSSIKRRHRMDGEVIKGEDALPIFSKRFVARFASSLARSREYSRLSDLLNFATSSNPPSTSRLHHLSRHPHLKYIHYLLSSPLGHSTTTKELMRALPFSIYVWPILQGRVRWSPRLPYLSRTVMSLKVSSALRRDAKTRKDVERAVNGIDMETLERAVLFLVRARRISAATKLALRLSPLGPNKIPTKIGNILLSSALLPSPSLSSSSTSPYHRRSRHRAAKTQIRSAAHRLKKLVKEGGFEPDRVTFNLLMKGLLRWKSLTPSEVLRSLFESIVKGQGGYAIPQEYLKAFEDLHSRSSSSTSSSSTSASAPAQTPLPMVPPTLGGTTTATTSFQRHTQPLLKMFANAFRNRGDKKSARVIGKAVSEMRRRWREEREVVEEKRRAGRVRKRERVRERLFKV